MHADQQRAELAVGGGPAADDDFMPGAAFGLGPALRAAGPVGRIAPAWKRCLPATSGRPIAAPRRRPSRNARRSGCAGPGAWRARRALLQPGFPLDQRQRPQIGSPSNSRSKTKKIRSAVFCSESAACSAAKSGAPFWSSATISPSMIASGKRRGLRGDRREFVGPVEALAGLQARLAVLHAQLDAIAVEFDLVHPAGAGGRPVDRLAQLRRDEVQAAVRRPGVTLGAGLAASLRPCPAAPRPRRPCGAVPHRIRVARSSLRA